MGVQLTLETQVKYRKTAFFAASWSTTRSVSPTFQSACAVVPVKRLSNVSIEYLGTVVSYTIKGTT